MTNYKTVFFALGVLLIILGFFMIAPVIVQLIYDELNGTFIYSSVVTIFIGILFLLSNLDQNKKLNLQQAFLLTSLSWIGIAIFGSLPFIFSSLELTFSDAFFESMSGITTTGSTIIGDLNNASKSNSYMEINATVAWWNWYRHNGNYSNAFVECWWNATI